MNRKRKPILLVSAFSPHMVGVRDFHIELDLMPQAEFEVLLKRGGVEACFSNIDHLMELSKYFGIARIPEHAERFLQLNEDSRVIWVTRDLETKLFTFTRVRIYRKVEQPAPIQQDLKFA